MNIHHHYYLILAFILSFCQASDAQFDKIQKLTTKDGLSQGMIFDILKDQDGFMWFATKNGLNRYDGYEFKVFTNDPFDTNSISGDAISKLFEDSKGRFWVGTLNSGLNLFDKKTQTFHRVQPSNLIEAYNLDKLTVYDIFEDKKGRIWFSNREQLFRLEVFEKDDQPHFEVKLITKTGTEVTNDFNFRVLLTSKDEILVYKMNEGIFIWDEASQQLKPYLIGSEYKAANCLMEAPVGVLWISQANKDNITLKRIENKKIVAEYTPPVSFNRSSQSGVIQVFKNP